jgi:cytochrome d ubiquinol oxidase subunit I
VWISLASFVLFYTVLLVVDLYLMIKYARLGPSESWEVPDLAARQAPPGGVVVDHATLRAQPRPAE